jgi:hypothetical protein
MVRPSAVAVLTFTPDYFRLSDCKESVNASPTFAGVLRPTHRLASAMHCMYAGKKIL